MKETNEADKDGASTGVVLERIVGPQLHDGDMPPVLWRVGDIVTRSGIDEHKIVNIDFGYGILDVECIKEPTPIDEDCDPWIKLGEIESNLIRRYSFVRH